MRSAPHSRFMHRVACLIRLTIWLFTVVLAILSQADSDQIDSSQVTEREFFRKRHRHAQAAFQEDQSNPDRAIRYVQSAFEWAELAHDSSERASIATPAIEVCRVFLSSSSHQARANYYLALNLGQLARTKWLGALKIVNEMEKRLVAAQTKDSSQDHGGPDRALSRLYFQAPRWPASIGNKEKAIRHAKRAIQIAPNYPGNRLSYLEILTDHRNFQEAKKQETITGAVMKESRDELTSAYWSYSWNTWDETWKTLQKKLAPKKN